MYIYIFWVHGYITFFATFILLRESGSDYTKKFEGNMKNQIFINWLLEVAIADDTSIRISL